MSNSVNEFLRVLAEALLIVLAVSFVSLGLHTRPLRIDMRPGLVVLLTIPLVLAITFLGMWALDINLHKISLGALIIALGLLVDDAIIAVEMMVRKMEEGYDRTAAVTFMYESTAFPMLTGTLITAAGFLPIALARSSAGEYTFSIFGVTALALVISWFVAVLFVPLLGVWLLKAPPRANGGEPHELFTTPFYSPSGAWSTGASSGARPSSRSRSRAWCSASSVSASSSSSSSRTRSGRNWWSTCGCRKARASGRPSTETKKFEQWLSEQPEVEHWVSYIGIGAPRFYLPLDQQFNNTNLAEIIVTPRSLAERDALRARMIELFRNDFPNLRGRVKLLPQGPPVSYPVQFRVQGTDVATVRSIADQVKDVVRANPNTVGVNDNWNEQVKSLRLTLDQDKARALGVSSQALAKAAQTVLSGTTVAQFREGNELIDIVLRQPYEERAAMSRLADANIPTASGRSVPLSQLVKVELGWEPGVVWRENRDYTITVQSEVKDGMQGPTVTAQIESELAALRARLPPGYRIDIGGATEESAKAGQSIAVNIPADALHRVHAADAAAAFVLALAARVPDRPAGLHRRGGDAARCSGRRSASSRSSACSRCSA